MWVVVCKSVFLIILAKHSALFQKYHDIYTPIVLKAFKYSLKFSLYLFNIILTYLFTHVSLQKFNNQDIYLYLIFFHYITYFYLAFPDLVVNQGY